MHSDDVRLECQHYLGIPAFQISQRLLIQNESIFKPKKDRLQQSVHLASPARDRGFESWSRQTNDL